MHIGMKFKYSNLLTVNDQLTLTPQSKWLKSLKCLITLRGNIIQKSCVDYKHLTIVQLCLNDHGSTTEKTTHTIGQPF